MATLPVVNGDAHVNGRGKGFGPDGLPVLPPIEKPSARKDPYANSKLKNFRMARHKQDLLRKIMYIPSINS